MVDDEKIGGIAQTTSCQSSMSLNQRAEMEC